MPKHVVHVVEKTLSNQLKCLGGSVTSVEVESATKTVSEKILNMYAIVWSYIQQYAKYA